MAIHYLLDTSVYCQPLRPHPSTTVQTRWQSCKDSQLAISSISVAELEYGLFSKGSERLWTAYKAILSGRLVTLDFTASVASVFGEMKAKQAKSGQIVDDFDLAIAATAKASGLTVATLNVRHFQRVLGLDWEDWSIS